MKVVINVVYGGFELPHVLQYLASKYFKSGGENSKELRTDPELVKTVEAAPALCSGTTWKLKVVNLPDETTDWMLNEEDGAESITYVCDGKLYTTK